MKKLIIIATLICTLAVIFSACEKPETPGTGQGFFDATVLEDRGESILVKCIELPGGSDDIPVGAEVIVSKNTLSDEPMPDIKPGDFIKILYIGEVKNTNPMTCGDTVSIFSIEEPGGDLNTFFCYDNCFYMFSGRVLKELPETAEYIGETENIGHIVTYVDLESNDDGAAYIDSADKNIGYFTWNNGETYLEMKRHEKE